MKAESSKLYRTIWRWHFYAGLFCIPFVLALSITGAIYLFKPQIDAWSESEFQNLSVGDKRATPLEHISAAQDHISGSSFVSYRIPQNDTQAIRITLSKSGERHLVYVHPSTLELLHHVPFDKQFIRIVRTLHGELLLGNFGSVLVELAGCWAIVLIFTGMYLWWPRSAVGLAGILYLRLQQGSRKFWRDLHAVTAFWVSAFTLFLLVSGLPWALVWGSAFKELRALSTPGVSQAWEIKSQPEIKAANIDAKDLSKTLTPSLLLSAQDLKFAPPVELGPDRKKVHLWKLSSQHQNRMLRADAWFDAQGELVRVKTFSDRSGTDKVIGIGISAHEGQLFGWLNQFLGLLVTLGLILVSVSGFVLWRKRKPKSQLGAPLALTNASVGKVVVCITLGLAAFLPLLALSLLLILVLEKFVLSSLPTTRRWLGLN